MKNTRNVITLSRLKASALIIYLIYGAQVLAQTGLILNPGFESGLKHWEHDKSSSSSSVSHTGSSSAKISRSGGDLMQSVVVEKNSNYVLSSYVRGSGVIGALVGNVPTVEIVSSAKDWKLARLVFNTGAHDLITIFAVYDKKEGRFDDFSLEKFVPDTGLKQYGLNSNVPPSGNFELSDWNLSVPIDTDGNGKADTISERQLYGGYVSKEFFYTAVDGGMVFKVPVRGIKTSKRTKFTRVELREMLRRGNTGQETKGVNKNNWVLGSASRSEQRKAAGVDGMLTGTLAVNHVTATGDKNQVGRVVVAQIHAKDDEPLQLVYRKLPKNTRGSIYLVHENRLTSDDTYYELIGKRSSSLEDPVDGITLNEKFGYEIKTKNNKLHVTIYREGKKDIVKTIDMSKSGYDVRGQYMYFKAGAYIQDNTSLDNDSAQVTYYALENKH